MRLLLDTHIWLWSRLEPDRLSRRVSRELQNPANGLWLSPFSLLETLILSEKGRLNGNSGEVQHKAPATEGLRGPVNKVTLLSKLQESTKARRRNY